MSTTKDVSKASRRILLAATAICLSISTHCAVAGGGGHSGDRAGVENHGSGMHDDGAKSHGFGTHDFGKEKSDFGHDRERADKPYERDDRDRRKSVDERTPVLKDAGKDKGGGIPATGPGSASKNTIHPIVTNDTGRPQASGSPSGGQPHGNTVDNTIHPIVTGNPSQPSANPPVVAGKLPPNDPVGNTHPTAGVNPPTVVSVSNGVTTTQIQNGLGGVTVYSDKPGTITVTNGKESTTLNGGSVTLSGNVVGVGGGQGVQVGPRNAEGNTVVAIKPPAPPPAAPTHVTGGPEGGFFGDLGSSIKDGVKAVGNGIEAGTVAVGKGIADGLGVDPTFEAHPVPGPVGPPPATSTVQQQ